MGRIVKKLGHTTTIMISQAFELGVLYNLLIVNKAASALSSSDVRSFLTSNFDVVFPLCTIFFSTLEKWLSEM